MSLKIAPLPKTPIQRVLTVIAQQMPTFTGVITNNVFTTTLGATMQFRKAEESRFHAFNLYVSDRSPLWTSLELRELAEECVRMADHLDELTERDQKKNDQQATA